VAGTFVFERDEELLDLSGHGAVGEIRTPPLDIDDRAGDVVGKIVRREGAGVSPAQ